MADSFIDRIVVPVASPDDAAATATALVPYVEGTDCTVIALHVIEKAGGAPDKASVEQREQYAEEVFGVVTDRPRGTEVTLETALHYGTDIAATIAEAANDTAASAIAFTPRGGSRWRKLLTGDVTHNLVENADIPILVLPDREVSEA